MTEAEEKAAAQEAEHRGHAIKTIAAAINRLGWDTRMQESDRELATKLLDASESNEREAQAAAADAESKAAIEHEGADDHFPF